MKKLGKISIEHLTHFICSVCQRWWSIGDAPPNKNKWFCPWCGKEQVFKKLKRHN